MTQSAKNVSFDQGLMMRQITKIVSWMQEYEKNPAQQTQDFSYNTTTAIPTFKESEGFCHALSVSLINAALVDYEKHLYKPNHTEPSEVDLFYQSLQDINSAQIPPTDAAEFYKKVSPFISMIWQLQRKFELNPDVLHRNIIINIPSHNHQVHQILK